MLERSALNRIPNRYREAKALSNFWRATTKKGVTSFLWVGLIIVGLGVLATSSAGSSSFWHLYQTGMISARQVDSISVFPQTREVRDQDDVLNLYPAYLRFALEVGKDVDSANAKRLANTYESLRQRSPSNAARFLKGLRFEMVQKVELMGIPPRRISTKSPEMRKWVAKWMKEWAREADEHLFRAVATPRVD